MTKYRMDKEGNLHPVEEQVKDMTDQQLNRALAELMAEKFVPGYNFMIYNPNGPGAVPVPKYCTDPAASQEVQAAACKLNKVRYIRNLLVVKGVGSVEEVIRWSGVEIELAADIATATNRERAEAAYMTLRGD